MLSGQLKMIPIGMCYIWKIEGDVSLPIFGDAASLLPTGRRFPRRPVSLYSAKMKICVLTSGGVDSAVLLGRSLETSLTVYPLYIRCGLAWEKAELHWLRRLLQALHRPSLRPLTVLDVPVKPLYEGHWSLTGRRVPGYASRDAAVYLPGRNLLFLSHAAVFCARHGLSEVWLGTLKANPFPDASPDFFRLAARTASKALGRSLVFRAPFAGLPKRAVVEKGRELPLHLAFSCLSPRGLRPCGRCNKCAERDKTLKAR
jgi:7-cyano-7-deazaguanine synthase